MSRTRPLPALAVAALIAAGCDAGAPTQGAPTQGAPAQGDASPAPASTPIGPAGDPVRATPLTPSGPPTTVQRQPADDALQQAASVVRVDDLAPGGVKLFGTAGGDPAMNGLYVHIAFFVSPAEGWTVFRIGDVLDYRVLSSEPGRVDLDLSESTYDEAAGTIGSRNRRVIVAWPTGPQGTPPATVSVTPAR